MSDQPRRVALGFYFNAIRSAYQQGRSAAQAWHDVSAAAEAQGLGLPTGGIQEMNRLYSIAAREQRGVREVRAAEPPNPITSEMVTLRPNARGPNERNAIREFSAEVEVRSQVGEEIRSRYVTIDFGSQLPPTIGDIREEARQMAESVAMGGITGSEPLEGDLLDVGDISLWES